MVIKKMLQPAARSSDNQSGTAWPPETIVAMPPADSCPARDSREVILAHLMLHRLLSRNHFADPP